MKKVYFLLILLYIFPSCKQDETKAVSKMTGEQQLIVDWKEKINAHKDSAILRQQFVGILDSLTMYPLAIEQVDSLILKDTLNNELWLTKAQLHENNKDTAEAIRSYEKALQIYPSVETQLYLANLFAENRNPKALALCRNVNNMGMERGTEANCNFIAGIYFARTGNNTKAIDLFDKAINENYTLMEAYMEKGFIYFESKNYLQSLKTFAIAIKINNQYADAYYWNAKCNEAMGNKEEAILNYKRALGLDKQMIEAKEALEKMENEK